MARFSDKINRLFEKEEWGKARLLLEAELMKRPDDHWVLTQIGVTYYEQKCYEESLKWFVKSKAIVPDCPLTLWNLAGAFDALGKYGDAIHLYTWLVECTKSAKDDPCWESKHWADALKTDCVYRLGVCFQDLSNSTAADFCFRRYIDLVLTGIEGSYSTEDARLRIQSLPGEKNGGAEVELKKLRAFLRSKTAVKRRTATKIKA